MSKPLDYNKWNNIEVSDDEDDTHPNIDTPSLFKWRHEARMQRMQELEAKKKAAIEDKKKKELELEALKQKMASSALSENEMTIIKKGLAELEKETKEAAEKAAEVLDEEKKMPLNVDTLSTEGFSKSIINKGVPRSNENLYEEIGRAHSELQSHHDLVCRLLLEKKKKNIRPTPLTSTNTNTHTYTTS